MATRKRDRKKQNAERKSPAALQRGIDREVDLGLNELDGLLKELGAALGQEESPKPSDTERNLKRARAKAESNQVLRQLALDASAFAARLPDPAAWAEFFSNRIRPTFNSILTNVKMCMECGRRFPANKKSDLCCSDECTSRKNNRGVKRATATEKFHRLAQRLKRHHKTCRACQAQKACAALEKMIKEDARLSKAFTDLRQDESVGAPTMPDEDLA